MMERSSPLAALQPMQSGPFGRLNPPRDYSSAFLKPYNYDSSNFNFRDMSMLKPHSDYFSFNAVRGSSPTASLAADLSQNFHIDQSPQLQTPRRALFANGNVANGIENPDIVTPPIPSSSPGPYSMDVSPLPHKVPFFATLGVSVSKPSPSEQYTPSLPQRTEDSLKTQRPVPLRRASNHVRPSLRKGYSTSAVAPKLMPVNNANSPFVFGPSSSWTTNVPLESFAESPPSVRKLQPSALTAPLYPSVKDLSFEFNGSPIGGITKTRAVRGARVGISRRTLSLHANDTYRPMRQEKRVATEGDFRPPPPFDETYKLKLPHFTKDDELDGLPRITSETLVEALKGTYVNDIGEITIIDCRFEYEYQGGHIDGAVNFNNKDELTKQLFDGVFSKSRALIFHCEYSACRAPRTASFIRSQDRTVNQETYPNLTYPEVYILDGGYSAFFKTHRSLCIPQDYVEMKDKDNDRASSRGICGNKRRAKLNRAHTYAFGQTATMASTCLATGSIAEMDIDMVDSPCAPALPHHLSSASLFTYASQ